MTFDPLSILVPLMVSGLGAFAGYLGRIANKLEDRRDDIYLKDLPAVYSSIHSFTYLFNIFLKGGSLEQFSEKLMKIIEALEKQIFSGDIIVFEDELHSKLIDFYEKARPLQMALEMMKNKNKEEGFRDAYRCKQDYPFGNNLKTNPSEVLKAGDELDELVHRKLKSYKSYSSKLLWLIISIGVLIGLVEFFKNVDYAQLSETTAIAFWQQTWFLYTIFWMVIIGVAAIAIYCLYIKYIKRTQV